MATIDSDNECIQRCPVPTFPLRVNLTSLHGIGLIRNQGRITVSVRPREAPWEWFCRRGAPHCQFQAGPRHIGEDSSWAGREGEGPLSGLCCNAWIARRWLSGFVRRSLVGRDELNEARENRHRTDLVQRAAGTDSLSRPSQAPALPTSLPCLHDHTHGHAPPLSDTLATRPTSSERPIVSQAASSTRGSSNFDWTPARDRVRRLPALPAYPVMLTVCTRRRSF